MYCIAIIIIKLTASLGTLANVTILLLRRKFVFVRFFPHVKIIPLMAAANDETFNSYNNSIIIILNL